MAPSRVRVDSGTSYEALLGLASVADPRFADVFSGTRDLSRAVRGTGSDGAELLRDVRRPGRFCWVNLLSLAAGGRRARTLTTLVETLEEADPAEVHRVALGWRRRQLRDLVDAEVVHGVLAGRAADRRALAAVYASGSTVLEATPWLLRARPAEVHDLVVRVLRGWGDLVLDDVREATLRQELRTAARGLRTRVRDLTPQAAIATVAPGLAYSSERMPDEVLLVPSPAVAPIVVFVDDERRTIVAAPPAVARPVEDAVLVGARALGDPQRLRVLDVLADGPLSAQELAARVGQPRTTLLHHLAQLRAAGVVLTSVGPTERTEYRLDAAGFTAFARAVEKRFGDAAE